MDNFYEKIMKPIILLALVGVAATATGVGFLNTEIMLNVQNLGVGSEDLETPISDANVDLSIVALPGIDLEGNSVFKNVINACSFHYPDNQAFPGLNNAGDATVICKLTQDGNVVAEGQISGQFAPSITEIIPINSLAFPGANSVLTVNDVTIVVLGNNPTPPVVP